MTGKLSFLITAAALVAAGCAFGRNGSRRPLAPGDPAPDFSLPGSDGATYRLSEYRGKRAVVLAWFPKASTPG